VRLLLIAALIVLAAPASARAEGSEQLNSKCQASCKSTLDRCAAAANRRMQTAIKETTAYNVGSAARESADVKFESAFLTAEGCWDRYYACTGKCRPPKACIDQCQSAFKRCFAAAEAKMRDGLGKMRTAKFGSPAWQAANAEGDAEADHCLQENRNCQAKCTNP
jgi:hypothetical protein